MVFEQHGFNASATFGVYNDVAGNQTNTTVIHNHSHGGAKFRGTNVHHLIAR